MYSSTSGALVAQAAVDTIANNLANVNTAGFKRTLLQVQSQPERELFRFQTDPGRVPNARVDGVATQQSIGTLGTGAQVYDTPADFQQGPIAATGNDLDVALSGPGFFALRAGNGALRYTRDGTFLRDGNGFLTAQNGDRVLGAVTGPSPSAPRRSTASRSSSSRTRPHCGPRARAASSTPVPPVRAPRRTPARCRARSRRATPTSCVRWST